MQYRCAKCIATRYLQSAGERNVMLAKNLLLSFSGSRQVYYCAVIIVSIQEFHYLQV